MLDSSAIPLTYSKILQSKSYTVFILGNEDKKFAIYTSAQVGENIQLFLSDEKNVRPSTHQFLQNLLVGCNANILQVVIYDVQDTLYFSKIFFETNENDKKRILEIEARPSDCLILALMNNAPIYCTQDTFEKVVNINEF